jgi:hypothetical protein
MGQPWPWDSPAPRVGKVPKVGKVAKVTVIVPVEDPMQCTSLYPGNICLLVGIGQLPMYIYSWVTLVTLRS